VAFPSRAKTRDPFRSTHRCTGMLNLFKLSAISLDPAHFCAKENPYC